MHFVERPVFEPVAVSLAFRFGEIGLWSKRLSGLADKRHFLEQPVISDVPDPVSFAQRTDFYFFPAYPVERPPKVIQERAGWVMYTPQVLRNFFIDLARLGTFEAYLAQFSSKTRSTLRRKVRRLAEADGGELHWRVARTTEEIEEFLRLALPLSERTYQARLLDVGLPASAEFADRVRSAASDGAVRGYLLFFKGQPAAYVLSFCRSGVATYDYVGYEPSLHDFSPGTVLQYLLLESMFQEPSLSVFDFTEGEGAHKELFSTDSRLCAKSYMLRATPLNVVTVRLHWGLRTLSDRAANWLDRLGLKQKIKRWLRTRA